MAKALHFGGEKTGQGCLMGAGVDLDAKNCGFSSNSLLCYGRFGESLAHALACLIGFLCTCLGTKSELDN